MYFSFFTVEKQTHVIKIEETKGQWRKDAHSLQGRVVFRQEKVAGQGEGGEVA